MIKDFDEWNNQKKNIHMSKLRPFFHEREIWFASSGINIGFEQNGNGEEFLRPVIVIKKFNNEIFWGISTTTKNKSGKHYFQLTYKKDRCTTAILSQFKLIDSKRLRYHIGNVNETDFLEMKKRIISFLE